MKEIECAFSVFTSKFTAEKSAFFVLFYTKWEEIDFLKNYKSPGTLFSHFRTNPVLH